MLDNLLLMIPGPIEISPPVKKAFGVSPPSHVDPEVIDAFGRSIEKMRQAWRAAEDSQPFIIPGSGTLAMDMAVANLVAPGDRVLVVNTGYFSDRITEMLRRRGANIHTVGHGPGFAPSADEVVAALDTEGPFKVLCATHVDTSTGVRIKPEPLARAASERGVLSIFDGVCATIGERFEMAAWGADVYLTGSQKAIGLPPGLALLVASRRALEARDALAAPPPMSTDWHTWLPVMQAYEERRPSYFATPPTNLILALDVALDEILDEERGMMPIWDSHHKVATAMRRAWKALELELVPVRESTAANTLSAIRYPEGIGPELLGRIKARG
ncbi:MAG: aminotransferase class V-fold PLP-dependent enzyme, partial [Myxococcota bacterium]